MAPPFCVALLASVDSLLPLASPTLGPTSTSTLISLPFDSTCVLTSDFRAALAELLAHPPPPRSFDPSAPALRLLRAAPLLASDGSNRALHYLRGSLAALLASGPAPPPPFLRECSRCLALLRGSLLPGLLAGSLPPLSPRPFVEACVASSLCATFGPDTPFLADLVSLYVSSCAASSPAASSRASLLPSLLASLLDPRSLDAGVLLLPGAPLSESRVTAPGELLLSRGLHQHPPRRPGAAKRLALMHADPLAPGRNAVSVELPSEELPSSDVGAELPSSDVGASEVGASADGASAFARLSGAASSLALSVAAGLARRGVTLLVAAFPAPPALRSALRKHGVSLVHCVEEREAEKLSAAAGVAFEEEGGGGLYSGYEGGGGEYESAQEITVGAVKYTRLVCRPARLGARLGATHARPHMSSGTAAPQLILRGFSAGKLKQIKKAAARAIACCRDALAADPGGAVCAGGGCAEVSMAGALEELRGRIGSGEDVPALDTVSRKAQLAALEMLAAGLLTVPRALWGEREFWSMKAAGVEALGEGGEGAAQPKGMTVGLVLTAVDILSQALRIGDVVMVKKIEGAGHGRIVKSRLAERGLGGGTLGADSDSDEEGDDDYW
ncbi:hypothetical protein TeGR_g9653 [Tetraparma gracilis]|uniref:Uncharacterized protein n=1 Tax=Tetraparma gracilis TaxID=2962635 RepID=A0ABQ6MBA5_9STRA|nr:hypothetical protein TeGR_g9653 [Tetraparma gracilis]